MQKTNEIHELTAAELEEVSGGFIPGALAFLITAGYASAFTMDVVGSVGVTRNLWEDAVAYHQSLGGG
jgi:lactobin A/cerein 7B family class IIb bacteriocin